MPYIRLSRGPLLNTTISGPLLRSPEPAPLGEELGMCMFTKHSERLLCSPVFENQPSTL